MCSIHIKSEFKKSVHTYLYHNQTRLVNYYNGRLRRVQYSIMIQNVWTKVLFDDMSVLFFVLDPMFAFEFLPQSKVNGTLMMHLSGAKNCYQIPTQSYRPTLNSVHPIKVHIQQDRSRRRGKNFVDYLQQCQQYFVVVLQQKG